MRGSVQAALPSECKGSKRRTYNDRVGCSSRRLPRIENGRMSTTTRRMDATMLQRDYQNSSCVNILETIVRQKSLEVARLPQQEVTACGLSSVLQKRGGLRGFEAALQTPRNGSIALIAEIKQA